MAETQIIGLTKGSNSTYERKFKELNGFATLKSGTVRKKYCALREAADNVLYYRVLFRCKT
jgi:hypothetical protein